MHRCLLPLLICALSGCGGSSSSSDFALPPADMDHDGDLDLVVGNRLTQNVIYLNDGAGGFTSSVDFGTGSDATRVVLAADLDRDGDLDLTVTNENAQDAVYFND